MIPGKSVETYQKSCDTPLLTSRKDNLPIWCLYDDGTPNLPVVRGSDIFHNIQALCAIGLVDMAETLHTHAKQTAPLHHRSDGLPVDYLCMNNTIGGGALYQEGTYSYITAMIDLHKLVNKGNDNLIEPNKKEDK